MSDDGLVMVTGPQLLRAADDLDELAFARLRNGVVVNEAQLRKAGGILSNGPQPICNGLKSDMPGFIDRDAQKGKSLVLNVGILPSRTYRIDTLGRARLSSSTEPVTAEAGIVGAEPDRADLDMVRHG